ncbi:unnamed protein product [Allacma fusca]|uniref:Uncharacterized protein n=1 Tax=Allacma fusca TaxID=39272 RepID=A0A8J2JLL9_9HEXA|nr:unnamed protein product [Allacma fusca]
MYSTIPHPLQLDSKVAQNSLIKFCQSTLQQGHTGRKDENCTEKQDGSALNNPSNRTNRNRLSVPQRKE